LRITYDGLELDSVSMRRFSREPVMDPTSGLDMLYDHVIIEGTFIVNPNKTSWERDTTNANAHAWKRKPGQTIGLAYESVRKTLQSNRRELVVYMGEEEILRSPNPAFIGAPGGIVAGPGTVYGTPGVNGLPFLTDENNGPIVHSADIIRVYGAHSFLVNFSVETWVPRESYYKNSALQQAASARFGAEIYENAILSNRYTISESFDDQYRTVIAYEGVAMFRTSVLDLSHLFQISRGGDKAFVGDTSRGVSPDSLRAYVVPRIRQGFRRVQGAFRLIPTRNAIAYQVVDREEYLYPGNPRDPNFPGRNKWGVVDFDFTYGQRPFMFEKGMAAVPANRITNLGQVYCKGSRYSHPYLMLQFGLAVIGEKLALYNERDFEKAREKGQAPTFLQHIECQYSYGKRVLTISAASTSWNYIMAADAGPGGRAILAPLWPNPWRLANQIDFLDNPRRTDASRQGSYQPPNSGATRGTYPYVMMQPLPSDGPIVFQPPNRWAIELPNRTPENPYADN
jgi:hypothetical protein